MKKLYAGAATALLTMLAVADPAAAQTAPPPVSDSPAPVVQHAATAGGRLDLVVQAVSPRGTRVRVLAPGATQGQVLTVTGETTPAAILKAAPGDVVTGEVDNVANPTSIDKVEKIARPIGKGARFLFGVLSAAILLGLAAIAAGWKLKRFIIGVDNRYSKSQFQLALWFGAVAVAYLTTVFLRVYELGFSYVGGVAMPENLLVLSGFSALGFGGAKMIAVQQQGATPVVESTVDPSLLRDLSSDDNGNPDLGDFQMVVITLIAVTIFIVTVFHALGMLAVSATTSLPDVDSTLLSIFGLGQGAYLAKKVAVPKNSGVAVQQAQVQQGAGQ